MKKNGYYVTVTLTFDPSSPISIGLSQYSKQLFNKNNVQIDSAGIFFSQAEPDIQTNCNENVTPPQFCEGVKK